MGIEVPADVGSEKEDSVGEQWVWGGRRNERDLGGSIAVAYDENARRASGLRQLVESVMGFAD